MGLLETAMELSKAYELLLKYGAKSAYDYIDKRGRDKSNTLVHRSDPVSVELVDLIRSMSSNGAHHSPKLDRLTSILKQHFRDATADTRVIIFTSYRESVKDIVQALREVPAWGGDANKVNVVYSGCYTDGTCWGEASVVRSSDGRRLGLAVGGLLRQYCSGPIAPDNVEGYREKMQMSVESRDYVLESFPTVRGESTWVGYAIPVNPETQTPRVVHVLQAVNVRARDWDADGSDGMPLWMGEAKQPKQRAAARLNMEGGLKAFVALVVNDCVALATGTGTALVHLCVGTKMEDEVMGVAGGDGSNEKEFVNALHGCMLLPSPRPGRPAGVLRVGPRELLMEKVARQMAAAIKAGTIEKRRVWCEFVVATGGKAKCQFTRIVKAYQFFFTGPDGRSFAYNSGPRFDAVGGGGLFLSDSAARGYRELVLRLPPLKGREAQISAQERTEEVWAMAVDAMKVTASRLWRRGDLMWAVSAAVKAVVYGCTAGGSTNRGDNADENERAAAALLPYARLWQTKGAQVILFIREMENLMDALRGRPPLGLAKRAAVHAQGLLKRLTFFFFHHSDGDRGEADVQESLGRAVVHELRRLLPESVGGENMLTINPPRAVGVLTQLAVRLRMLAFNLLEHHISKTEALRVLIEDALGTDRRFPVVDHAVPQPREFAGIMEPPTMVPWTSEDPYGFGKPVTLVDLKAEISFNLRHRLIPQPAIKEGSIMRYLIMSGVHKKLIDLYLETLKPPIAKDPYTDIYDSLLTSATLHETVEGIGNWLPVARAIFADGSRRRTPKQWHRDFAPAFAEGLMSVLDSSEDAHEGHDQAWGMRSAVCCFLPQVLVELGPLKDDLAPPSSFTKGAYLVRTVTSLEGLWGATAACGGTLFTVHFLDHLFVDGPSFPTALSVSAESIVTAVAAMAKVQAGIAPGKVGAVAFQGLHVGVRDDPGFKYRVLRLGDIEGRQRECIATVAAAFAAGRPITLRAAFLSGLRSGVSTPGYTPVRKRFVVYHRSMTIDKTLERTTDVIDAASPDLPQDADIRTVWGKDVASAVAEPMRFKPFEPGSARSWAELGGFRDRAGHTHVFLSAEDAKLWHDWVFPEEEAAEELTHAYKSRLKLLKLSLMIQSGFKGKQERMTAEKIALAWSRRAKVLVVLRRRAIQRVRQESNDLAVYEYQLRRKALRARHQGNYLQLFRMVLRAGLALGHRDVVAECARVFLVDSVDSLVTLNKVNTMFREFADQHQVSSFVRALDVNVLYDQFVNYAQSLPVSLFGAKAPFFRSFATRLAVERALAATHKNLSDAKQVRRPITPADVASLAEVHEVTKQSVNTFLALAFRNAGCERVRKLVAIWTAGLSGMALPPRQGVSADEAFDAEEEEELKEQEEERLKEQQDEDDDDDDNEDIEGTEGPKDIEDDTGPGTSILSRLASLKKKD